jgi:hypothetical protein
MVCHKKCHNTSWQSHDIVAWPTGVSSAAGGMGNFSGFSRSFTLTMSQMSDASVRAHIRRESLDIYNRLRSIQVDIAFVNKVRGAYPAIPLMRIAPSHFSEFVHFSI